LLFAKHVPNGGRRLAGHAIISQLLSYHFRKDIRMSSTFLIVDDHPLFREALQLAVQSAFPGARMVEASSIAAAKEALAVDEPFDLVLLDLSMPGTRGFEGLIELRTLSPKQPIVIVSALEDPRIIHEAMTYGAAGFISKSVKKPELAEAIQDVMAGLVTLPKGYQPPRAEGASREADLPARLATLTPQQLRVLQMVRQGKLNKQIAYELGVGETTVKAHVSEILRKLNVASRTQAVIEVSRLDFEAVLGIWREADDSKARPHRS
jgi:DNA-binding NarL/FixJ family response regulator